MTDDAVDVDLDKNAWSELGSSIYPLTLDLPDEIQMEERRYRALLVDKEEAERLFEETQAQL